MAQRKRKTQLPERVVKPLRRPNEAPKAPKRKDRELIPA